MQQKQALFCQRACVRNSILKQFSSFRNEEETSFDWIWTTGHEQRQAGHTHHTGKPRRTHCTLKQIWPLTQISEKISHYITKTSALSSKSVGSTSSTRLFCITVPITEMSLLVSEDVNMLVAATGNLFVHLSISLSVYSQASVCLKSQCNACLCSTNPVSVWRRGTCDFSHYQDSVFTLHSFL